VAPAWKATTRGRVIELNRSEALLYGDQDVRSPVEVGQALQAGIPGSSLVILSGVAHLSSVEGAEKFNREVRNFLERNRD
jgi:pimeloyl-ACP methyl ester carboxylesterase